MPAVESQMLALGTTAPRFSLPDPDGTLHSMRDDAPATLVMFLSNHCPFVQHIRSKLARIGSDYGSRDVAVCAINSNDVKTYPADRPSRMKEEAAACTPDFFVFDADQKLAYRGQLDGSRPNSSVPVDGCDLRAALDAVLKGNKPAAEQKPRIGCSIKWIAGNEPDYF